MIANGETEEKVVPADYDDWMTFNFVGTKPEVAASTVYYLCFWHNTQIKFYFETGTFHQMINKQATYNSWVNGVDEYVDIEYSIYATYEEAPPPKKKTLVQMVNI